MKNLTAIILSIYIIGYVTNLTLKLEVERFAEWYYLWEKSVSLLLMIFLVKTVNDKQLKFAAKVALTISIIRFVWEIFLILNFNLANNQLMTFGVWLVVITLTILAILKSIGKWK